MSYGISVVNDYGSIIVDSDYKVMVFSERGTFRITSKYTDKEGGGVVVFVRAILTQEPPQVFLRCVSGVHNNLGIYITMLGAAGAWTGFKITSAVRGGKSLQNYLVEYVSCKYADQPCATSYGMEIRNANGNIVFSSSDRIVKYGKFAKNWVLTSGIGVDVYESGLVIDLDDFVCVSAMDRGVMWFGQHSNYAGMTILAGGVPVLRIHNDVSTAGGIGTTKA